VARHRPHQLLPARYDRDMTCSTRGARILQSRLDPLPASTGSRRIVPAELLIEIEAIAMFAPIRRKKAR